MTWWQILLLVFAVIGCGLLGAFVTWVRFAVRENMRGYPRRKR